MILQGIGWAVAAVVWLAFAFVTNFSMGSWVLAFLYLLHALVGYVELGTDGCSFVTGAYVECCMEHDIFYRTGKTLDGKPISKRQADARLRACMMSRSKLGFFSPIAWWRWAGLRLKAVLL